MPEHASKNSERAPCILDAQMLKVMLSTAAYQARRVGRTLKLSPAEREDVEQEILLVLLERRRFFDATRGPWTPFAYRVARQAAQSVADNVAVDRTFYGIPLDQPCDDVTADDEEPATIADVKIDDAALTEADILDMLSVIFFVHKLPIELRIVAEAALMADGDLADAQRALGLSTSEFYRRLREVRYRMFTLCLVDRKRLNP